MALPNTQDEGPADLENTADTEVRPPAPPPFSAKPPRLLIIGAGSRGRVYGRCTIQSSNGVVAAVVEPDDYKREEFGRNFIWGDKAAPDGSHFTDWRDFITWELGRREREKAGEVVPEGVDAAFICVRDEMHHDVLMALAPLDLHVMCEKPLATTLDDCVDMYRAMAPHQMDRVFSIGHVMRYSPHNMMLRKLLLEDKAIGDILSVMHTEPVGFWHFSHSYVRGNWRKKSTTAPSLLTKSCHDIDIILWLLCSPPPGSDEPPHLPTSISSAGSLQFFKKSRKPKAAGSATNCLSCAAEKDCLYSSKKIYISPKHQGIETGNIRWPVSVVLPDIESFGGDHAKVVAALLPKLAEDYDESTLQEVIDSRNWWGRCVFESDNDVCDEQVVTMTWDEDPLPASSAASSDSVGGRGSKQATFHMIAQTKKQCHRYSYIYGTEGEVYADSKTITVEDFRTGATTAYKPKLESLGHGGGDHGLTRQFVLAVDKVKNHSWAAARAQREYIGCSLEEIIRSHVMVFAAEEARIAQRTVVWKDWWDEHVGSDMLDGQQKSDKVAQHIQG
ncbi:Uu.00g011280.m01.CDS01 [Anthostomella pinea]|uniref:Uu.00g011280.m01.CDS01 n=1 Tax=Anthostomella pinea TaxID=933095 RepID=A0AAI8YQ05_9PEZI|nr:Uu.00g011280.m01.CDS01 [Anthostomella pinea]